MITSPTLPGVREQARHALLLLGAPAPARLVVDVHTALFDGDLSMAGLATVLREEERHYDPDALTAYRICPALHHDLTVARGQVALSGWPAAKRLVSPRSARAHALAAVVRIAEFVAIRAHAGSAVLDLLRRLADTVPGGAEAFLVHDPRALADAARAALADVPAEPVPEAVERRWAALDERQRLFGVMSLPHQRGRG
ncbi:hypothetical protein Asp14428_34960 [Actinoplanes sp. NBRC 14428]|uniref:Uncharacterized protein n=1 Tax=Pseudosporangium ferrugineum TaxID=439699 RepID=A0A2T0S376_9ACTN|nr:hypothetical protein [Pseudosporangium ferrugineum]PRY27886.1 hypothetical protein CLV70_10940 [Pseudosporangium ferrugineum]BCJ52021.1 hypothetical protein Asp14428_34960 [Actinoplanes sp. NBRC 14428]